MASWDSGLGPHLAKQTKDFAGLLPFSARLPEDRARLSNHSSSFGVYQAHGRLRFLEPDSRKGSFHLGPIPSPKKPLSGCT